MLPCDFDLVVIGGGPGGSTAAALARQRGLRVMVAEKEQFPRFHIGESLLPMGNKILRETGFWPKLADAGFVPKFGATFYLSNGRATKDISFSQSLARDVEEYTYQVERSKFDAMLLEHARELGAEVRLQHRVSAIISQPDGHKVQIESAAGTTTVSARWVIDASGRESGDLTPQKRIFEPSTQPKRVAIYSHFTGVARPPGRTGGDTVAVRWDHGWFWLIPIGAQLTSIGLVTTTEALRESGLAPEGYFLQTVERSSKLRELLSGSVPTMPYRVTSDYSYFRKNLASDRMFLIGDAAGFFDPIFSSGVYMSMWTARRALGLIVLADAGGRGLSKSEQRRYSAAVKRHAGVFQRLIDAFYDNASFAVFMSPGAPWQIRSAICSVVAGHARLTWPLWWRFQAFFLVCWLQRRRIRVCPPLDYSAPPLDPTPTRSIPAYSQP